MIRAVIGIDRAQQVQSGATESQMPSVAAHQHYIACLQLDAAVGALIVRPALFVTEPVQIKRIEFDRSSQSSAPFTTVLQSTRSDCSLPRNPNVRHSRAPSFVVVTVTA